MDFLDICTMVFATYKTRRNFKLLIFLSRDRWQQQHRYNECKLRGEFRKHYNL